MAEHGYELIDSGKGRKLERFGPYVLDRPCTQAEWAQRKPRSVWDHAHAAFGREKRGTWQQSSPLPSTWNVTIKGLQFRLSAAPSGQVSVFPEHRSLWAWLARTLTAAQETRTESISLLNLFAYSGGTSIAAARAGVSVCHLDGSKAAVARARENAALNGLEKAPVRWIVDDVPSFIKREERRGRRYDAIVLDPPSFGRGRRGEVFKIERDLPAILEGASALLSEEPVCVLLSCHTPGFAPSVLRRYLSGGLGINSGAIECAALNLTGNKTAPIPSGAFARWCV